MKKLLIVASADTIFITNYVRALKLEMDVEVHVYSPFPPVGNYTSYPYDYVYFEDNIVFRSRLLNKVSFLLTPFVFRKRLSSFLKQHNCCYDYIHFHRILPSWVLRIDEYKRYAEKVILTFWGGEIDVEHILFSKTLYMKKLDKLVKSSDAVANPFSDKRYFDYFPILRQKGFEAVYGSSIIDCINKLQILPEDAKSRLSIASESITVMIGYSGKRIHNHIPIIESIFANPNYCKIKDRLHLIISMTRGGSEDYIREIISILNEGEVKYTIISGGYSSDEDVAILRRATDFVFQLSDFDGVSSSIKECLCAGSIVITGNWLPYNMLKSQGFVYPEVSGIDEGIEVFYELLNRYPSCKDDYSCNRLLGNDKFSWNACIKDWVDLYMRKNNVEVL